MGVPVYQPAKWRWARNGAAIGFVVILSDMLFAWRGVPIYPWTEPDYIAANVGQFIGSMLAGAAFGWIAGALRDRNMKARGQISN